MTSKAEWNVRNHIPLEQIIVQSHRGAGYLMPENSMPAFELAWSLDTIPEADLRTTRDGVIVAFHDSDFRRTLRDATEEQQRQGIQDLTWEQVRRLSVGAERETSSADAQVPSLADILANLAAHPQRRMYIDIKNVDLEQLAREADDAGVAAQLILASAQDPVIRRWKTLAPASSTLRWMGGTEEYLEERLRTLRSSGFEAITQLQIHVRRNPLAGAEPFTPSSKFLAQTGSELRAHSILFQVLPYDIQDTPTLWALLDLGVASFATDYPDVTMEAIRRYYSRDSASNHSCMSG